MNWIELPAGQYSIRKTNKVSSCQLEVDIKWDKLISHAPEEQWSAMAPFRILSFDIECAGRKGTFPDAKIDPVIQIANMVTRQGKSLNESKATLNPCHFRRIKAIHSKRVHSQLMCQHCRLSGSHA